MHFGGMPFGPFQFPMHERPELEAFCDSGRDFPKLSRDFPEIFLVKPYPKDRGRVNREAQTVNWEAGKKGAVETGVKSGLKKARKPWIRGKKGAQTPWIREGRLPWSANRELGIFHLENSSVSVHSLHFMVCAPLKRLSGGATGPLPTGPTPTRTRPPLNPSAQTWFGPDFDPISTWSNLDLKSLLVRSESGRNRVKIRSESGPGGGVQRGRVLVG